MGNCIGALIAITVFFVQFALRVLHVTLHGLVDDPCPADGCEKWPRNRSERVDMAAIYDPAKQIDGDSSEGNFYKRHTPAEPYESMLYDERE